MATEVELPLAALENRDVNWVDVSGWGVLDGVFISVAAAKKIAARINKYHGHRIQRLYDTPVAEIVSAHGDPEAFGERELVARADIQKFPYRTKLYVAPATVKGQTP